MSNTEEHSKILTHLQEILESIDFAVLYAKDISSADEFLMSPSGMMKLDACTMRLQVIGEHVGKLMKYESKPLTNYPQIPWHAIYGLRNLISHEYANIDEAIVFSTIKNDLTKLKEVIIEIQKKHEIDF